MNETIGNNGKSYNCDGRHDVEVVITPSTYIDGLYEMRIDGEYPSTGTKHQLVTLAEKYGFAYSIETKNESYELEDRTSAPKQ